MEDVKKENEELKAKVKELERVLDRKKAPLSNAYYKIKIMITDKVEKEIEKPEGLKDWMYKDDISRAERKIMSDLKWELRVRNIKDFTDEHIEPAKKYIENYKLPKELKKSRWVGC